MVKTWLALLADAPLALLSLVDGLSTDLNMAVVAAEELLSLVSGLITL